MRAAPSGKIGVGGYIEGERDYSIETDPHLHVTGYAQYLLYTSVKVALGGWAEGRRLGKETRWVDKKTEEKREVERYRYGLRAHLEVEHDTKRVRSSMMIEYLPHFSFDAYRISVSPEFEFKFKVCDKHFALVLHGEIDYYSEEEDLTIEPLVDITKPLEIRWTQADSPPFLVHLFVNLLSNVCAIIRHLANRCYTSVFKKCGFHAQ